MSEILQAPSAWLALVASAANNANLRLTYWLNSPQMNAAFAATVGQPTTGAMLVATGAAAAACIDTVDRVLTALPTVPTPSPAPALNQRGWALTIPACQGTRGLGVLRDVVLGEYCETSAEEPGWLLALGFTPFTPVSSVPIPQTC